jgi:hypothetical protein
MSECDCVALHHTYLSAAAKLIHMDTCYALLKQCSNMAWDVMGKALQQTWLCTRHASGSCQAQMESDMDIPYALRYRWQATATRLPLRLQSGLSGSRQYGNMSLPYDYI